MKKLIKILLCIALFLIIAIVVVWILEYVFERYIF